MRKTAREARGLGTSPPVTWRSAFIQRWLPGRLVGLLEMDGWMDQGTVLSLVPGVMGIFGCGWMDGGGGVGWRGRVGIMRTWYGKVLLAMVTSDSFLSKISIS